MAKKEEAKKFEAEVKKIKEEVLKFEAALQDPKKFLAYNSFFGIKIILQLMSEKSEKKNKINYMWHHTAGVWRTDIRADTKPQSKMSNISACNVYTLSLDKEYFAVLWLSKSKKTMDIFYNYANFSPHTKIDPFSPHKQFTQQVVTKIDRRVQITNFHFIEEPLCIPWIVLMNAYLPAQDIMERYNSLQKDERVSQASTTLQILWDRMKDCFPEEEEEDFSECLERVDIRLTPIIHETIDTLTRQEGIPINFMNPIKNVPPIYLTP